jgi:hypothetical protein
MRIAIVGDPSDVALAGLEGRFGWGEAVPASLAHHADFVVSLKRTNGSGSIVVSPREGRPGGERVISTGLEGTWARAPWPVNDRVFELDAPAPGAGVLVAGGRASERTDLADRVVATGLHVAEQSRLTVQALCESAVVVVPGGDCLPLPIDAMAVLAARRVLVTPRCRPAFGLRTGVDHAEARTPDEAVVYAAAALKHWVAFGRMRAFGVLAARRHLASMFYAKLAADLAMEESAQTAAAGLAP